MGIFCLGSPVKEVLERLKKMQVVPKPLSKGLGDMGFTSHESVSTRGERHPTAWKQITVDSNWKEFTVK